MMGHVSIPYAARVCGKAVRPGKTPVNLNFTIGAGALELPAGPDVDISSVAYDSRCVTAGSLFVAIEGEVTNGNRFIPEALARGARAVVSELPPPLR